MCWRTSVYTARWRYVSSGFALRPRTAPSNNRSTRQVELDTTQNFKRLFIDKAPCFQYIASYKCLDVRNPKTGDSILKPRFSGAGRRRSRETAERNRSGCLNEIVKTGIVYCHWFLNAGGQQRGEPIEYL